jgi:CARDB protein
MAGANLLGVLQDSAPPLQRAFNSPFPLRTKWNVYLPFVELPTIPPDLIIDNIAVMQQPVMARSPIEVQVTIRNTGNTAITQAFWVDFYINPPETPRVNPPSWSNPNIIRASWRVYGLGVGAQQVLSTNDTGDPQDPSKRYSNFHAFPHPGEQPIYVLVDSYAPGNDDGAVAEIDEHNNLRVQSVTVTHSSKPAASKEAAPARIDARPIQ